LWLAFRTWQVDARESRPIWMALGVFLAAAAAPRRSLRLFPSAFHAVGWCVLALAGLDLLGILPQGLFGAWRNGTIGFLGHQRLSGTFPHPNLLAFFLLAQWFNGFWILRSRRLSGRSGWPVHLFSLLTILALSLTLSRSVLFGGAAIVVLAAHRMARRGVQVSPARFDYVAAAVAALVLGLVANHEAWFGRFNQLGDISHQAKQNLAAPTDSVVSTSEDGPSSALPRASLDELNRMSRVEMWRDGLALFESTPLAGLGVGGFYRHGRGHLHAHNILIEVAVSGGAVALLLAAATLFLVFFRVRKFRWWHILVILPLVTGFFDCFLFFNYPLLLTVFALGIAARRDDSVEPVPVSARLVLDDPFLRFLPRTQQHGRAVTLCAFLGFTILMAISTPMPPADFYAYYAATQYTQATGDMPYLAWPSRFEVPASHPLGAYALALHGTLPVRFFYPPTALLLFSPLAWIPQVQVAAFSWFAVQIVLLLLLALGASRLAGYRGLHWLVLLAVLSHSPVSSSILYGQVSLPLATLAVWVWLLHRDGHSIGAGLLLSLGVALKVFPLLWLGFLLIRPRGWARFLGGCLFGTAVLTGLSLSVYGADLWRAFHFWVLGPLTTYSPSESISVRGLVFLLGSSNGTPLHWVLLIALTAFFAWGSRIHRRRGGSPDILAVGIVALSVLASPVAWYHYACLATGFLAAFAGRIDREGLTPLALVSIGLLLVTGLEFTGVALPQAALRASMGFVVLVLLPWLLMYLGSPRRVLWNPFIRQEEMTYESPKTT